MNVYIKTLVEKSARNFRPFSNDVDVTVSTEYFSGIACYYKLIVWTVSFLLAYWWSALLGNLLLMAGVEFNYIAFIIILRAISVILWLLWFLYDAIRIFSIYRNNKKDNLPVLSTKLVLNGMASLKLFTPLIRFHRDYVYLNDNDFILHSLFFEYAHMKATGSLIMTGLFYSAFYYHARIFIRQEKKNYRKAKKKKKKDKKLSYEDAKQTILKEMLKEVEAEKVKD